MIGTAAPNEQPAPAPAGPAPPSRPTSRPGPAPASMVSSTSQVAEAPPAPSDDPTSPEGWLRRCWSDGVTATFVARVRGTALARAAAEEDAAGLRAFSAMAAMGHGDYGLADELLGAGASQPGEPPLSAPVALVDAAARLYRACGEAEQDPERAVKAMQALHQADHALASAEDGDTPEAATARGYAGLSLAEALLMVGDIGAARHHLELAVCDERDPRPPMVLRCTARCILGGIELAVGRGDLAVAHLQKAVRDAAGFRQEEQTARLLLVGAMLIENHRYGEALLRELMAQHHLDADIARGHGTLSHLHRLLEVLSKGAPFSLPKRVELRELLRFLQGRHYSAGWFLLLTSLAAGGLGSAGDASEAYNTLVHAAATLRCRRMEGAADLCDRQVDALRVRLGEERFEEVLTEARERRRTFLTYLNGR